jgi:hypothetical protein
MKLVIRSIFLLVCLSMCPLGFSAPNFSGNWAGNIARTDTISLSGNGNVQVVQKRLSVMQVRQNGESLDVESVWSNSTSTNVTYILDGKEHPFNEQNGTGSAYRATLRGHGLLIETTRKIRTPFGEIEIPSTEEWALSADLANLTVVTTTQRNPGSIEAMPASIRSNYPDLFDSEGNLRSGALEKIQTQKHTYARQ